MALHKNMTGADVHEPKGVESAVAGTVYVSNGTGSGTWQNRYSGLYDLNKFYFTSPLANIASASSLFFPVPVKSELFSLSVVLYNAITVSNITLSLYINGVLFADNLVVPFASSTVGTLATLNVVTANTITANSVVEIRSSGNAGAASIAMVALGLRAKP